MEKGAKLRRPHHIANITTALGYLEKKNVRDFLLFLLFMSSCGSLLLAFSLSPSPQLSPLWRRRM